MLTKDLQEKKLWTQYLQEKISRTKYLWPQYLQDKKKSGT